MAFITLAGTLRDPTSELAVGDQIRFTHKSTTGETVEGAVSILTIDPSGTYSKDLQYGLVLVEYKDVRTSQFKNLGVATVNGSNPATSIPELLNALVPVSSAELIEFQVILADAVTARNDAEAFANSIDLINDLSQTYYCTRAEYEALPFTFPVGKIVHLNDRNADFKVIAGTGTGNTLDIIASTTVNQSVQFNTSKGFLSSQLGGFGDGTTDDMVLISRINVIIANGFKGKITIDRPYKLDMVKSADHRTGLTNVPMGLYLHQVSGVEILFSGEGKLTTFDAGADITSTGYTGRYYILSVQECTDITITTPHILGERDAHTGDGSGEQGYGIYNYNSNTVIERPKCDKCWGDGILWYSPDVVGGHIKGEGVYKENRRQGVSVITCNQLRIDRTVGINTNGAPLGPWASLDVEPDQPTQPIIGLSIGDVVGFGNDGPAFLFAPFQLNSTSSPFDCTVESVLSRNCLSAVEARCDNPDTLGSVKIGYVSGVDSDKQDFQSTMWSDSASLTIDELHSTRANQSGQSSSSFAVAVGIYRNESIPATRIGNIRIKSLTVNVANGVLKHPIAIADNSGDGGFASITIDKIKYDYTKMGGIGIHNPVNCIINTDSEVTQEFSAGSATLSSSTWVNTITNLGAPSTRLITVPTNYGWDGMKLNMVRESDFEFRCVFLDLLEGDTSDIRVFSGGSVKKGSLIKVGSTWAIDKLPAGIFSQGGKGTYSHGNNLGGSTSSRPSSPFKYQRYFDLTISREVIYNGTDWIRTDNGTVA